MQFIKKLNFPILFRIPVLAFVLMSIATFIFSSSELNYYNLESLTLRQLYFQLAGFLLLCALLSLLYNRIDKETMSLLISFSILLFMFFFSKSAPAESLMIGAVLVSIPPTYFSFSSLLSRRKDLLNIQGILASLNVVMFAVIMTILALNSDTVFAVSQAVNDSGISNAEFIYGNRKGFLNLGLGIAVLVLLVFILNNKYGAVSQSKLAKYLVILAIASLSAYEIYYMALTAVNHIRSLYTPTYDFGIFAQTFYSMRDGNGAVNTLERSRLLSHFSIHMSPVFYLALPIFMIFPFPETLGILQILIVAIGMIPLYLIAKEFKLNRIVTAFLLLIYIFHPAIMSSSFYDFHENCFLAPMLLFVIYFMIKQKWYLLVPSIIITLMIKEDASIYLVLIGIYFIFGFSNIMEEHRSKKFNLLFSIGMIVVSLLYFILVTNYLDNQGVGAMFWRYSNLNGYEDFGTIGIVISMFQNPSFLLATMFTPEKIYTLLVILLFMGFVPLLSKNLSDYWLIVPLILFNLASGYAYQHVLGFQYFYGSGALLVYMMAVAFKGRATETSINLNAGEFKYVIYIMAITLITVFGVKLMYTKDYINDAYVNNVERNIEMKEFLLTIPEDANVLATGYLTTYLADVDVLYDIQYYDLDVADIDFDYIILDLRVNPDSNVLYEIKALANGYVLSDLSSEYMKVFVPAG